MGNIAQFMNYAAPYKGNFINSFLYLENALKKEKINMIYIFPKQTENKEWIKSLISEGKKIFFLKGNFIIDVILLRNIIKSENIRIIHLHFSGYREFLLFRAAEMLSHKLYYITHLHNHYKQKKYKIIENILRMIRKSKYYIGVSDSVAQDMIKVGFKKSKVLSIPNSIDFTRLNKYDKNEKDKLNVKDKKVILMFGSDYYRKGVDLVIKALKDIAIKENILLLISLSDNNEIVKNNIINELGEFPKWIKLIESRNDVATYYNIADIFISSSREEGFCYSLVEAAYCNCMVVASEIPAQDSLNIPHTFYYDVENLDKLRKAITDVFSITRVNKARINDEQKKFVESRYSLEKWGNQIINIYNRVLKINLL